MGWANERARRGVCAGRRWIEEPARRRKETIHGELWRRPRSRGYGSLFNHARDRFGLAAMRTRLSPVAISGSRSASAMPGPRADSSYHMEERDQPKCHACHPVGQKHYAHVQWNRPNHTPMLPAWRVNVR